MRKTNTDTQCTKIYKKPELKRLGDMVVVTQGSGSGVNDPGGAQITGAKTPKP